jgi:transcriptional regulator with XRE-family HTH domain
MFGALLKKYRKKSGMTQGDLAHRVEILTGKKCKTESISSYEKDTNPKIETIYILAEILNIPVQFLFDDNEKAIDVILKNKMPSIRPLVANTFKIDMISGHENNVKNGHLQGMENIPDVMYLDKMMIDKKYHKHKLKGLICVGDSMQPYLRCGDIAIFCSLPHDKEYFMDGKYAISTSQGIMIKNISFSQNGDLIISSSNKEYISETIKKTDQYNNMHIIGSVVGRILKG